MYEKNVNVVDSRRMTISIIILVACSIVGIFIKHLINPMCNIITGILHVPGGISTSVSLMFLVTAYGVTEKKWSATFMGLTQGITALAIGMMGSMGPLMSFAYLIPGVVIDLVMLMPIDRRIGMFLANTLASIAAALFANLVVFHLPIMVLLVYVCLSAVTGATCGIMAGFVTGIIKNKGEIK